MKALIDGDLVVYMACAANEIIGDFDDGLGETAMYDVGEATMGAIRLIRRWTRDARCKKSIICFSEGENFRKKIYPQYKANREDVVRPQALLDVRDAIEDEFECWAIDGLEADDVMGIAGTRDPGNFVIVSRDKDMKTLPATIYNPDHDKRPHRIRQQIADRQWLIQSMTGDTTDGYSGIPNVGPVKAEEIVDDPHLIVKAPPEYYKRGPKKGQQKPTKWVRGQHTTVWGSMVSYAQRYGITEQDLITQARLARILRTGDFDTNTRTVKLWLPGGGHEELSLD